MFQAVLEFFSKLNNLEELIRWGGYSVLAFIVFAETGLFFGFLLPGDSLLVTAGLFAASGAFDIGPLFFIIFTMAILGDATGFEIGRFSGQKLFQRKDTRFFKRKHLEQTQAFYERHGGKTIILARFTPVVRSFAPLVAGVAGMPYGRFVLYNVSGAFLWTASMLGIGYILGRSIPNVNQYIHIIVAVVVFLSILPALVSYLRTGHWKTWFKKIRNP